MVKYTILFTNMGLINKTVEVGLVITFGLNITGCKNHVNVNAEEYTPDTVAWCAGYRLEGDFTTYLDGGYNNPRIGCPSGRDMIWLLGNDFRGNPPQMTFCVTGETAVSTCKQKGILIQ